MPTIKVSDEVAEIMAAAIQNGIITSFNSDVFDVLPNDEYKRSYAKAALLLNEYPKEQLLMVIDDLKQLQCCGERQMPSIGYEP